MQTLPSGQTVPHTGLDLIAFGKVEHLAMETDSALQILVVRRGSGKDKIRVKWKTENVSVLPESFLDISGEISLGENEMSTVIQLEIIDNEAWNIEALQLVHLFEPTNCVMVSTYLRLISHTSLVPGGIENYHCYLS